MSIARLDQGDCHRSPRGRRNETAMTVNKTWRKHLPQQEQSTTSLPAEPIEKPTAPLSSVLKKEEEKSSDEEPVAPILQDSYDLYMSAAKTLVDQEAIDEITVNRTITDEPAGSIEEVKKKIKEEVKEEVKQRVELVEESLPTQVQEAHAFMKDLGEAGKSQLN